MVIPIKRYGSFNNMMYRLCLGEQMESSHKVSSKNNGSVRNEWRKHFSGHSDITEKIGKNIGSSIFKIRYQK